MGMKITGFDQLEALFEKGKRIDQIAKKAVDQAAPLLESSLSSKIAGAASRGYASGELAGSIGSLKARKNERGVFAVVGPKGTDSRGVRNAEKLAYLEYGTSRGQVAHPVRASAAAAAESPVKQAMEEVLYAELGVRG